MLFAETHGLKKKAITFYTHTAICGQINIPCPDLNLLPDRLPRPVHHCCSALDRQTRKTGNQVWQSQW